MDRILQRIASNSDWSGRTATFYQDNRVVRLTLSELDALARRVARWLRDRGLREGQRIGILSRNRLEWALLDLAAIKARLVTAGFEHGSIKPRPELLREYGLAMIFTDHDVEHDGYFDIRKLLEALPEAPLEPAPVSYADDDATTIKFTSGSTGVPKGIAASVGSVDSSIDAVQKLFHHGPEDRLLVFLPLSLLQQRYWIYSALYYGHDVVVVAHEFALYACKQERPTVIMGVPSFFDAVKLQIEAKATGAEGSERLPALRRIAKELLGGRIRYLWTGSAPAKVEMLRFFEECETPIFEGYGMNETCIVSKNTPSANRVGSVGRLLDRKHVRFDEHGVLIVRSEFPVNRRYLYCAEGESEKIFLENGDVRTGDLAEIDADGYLYIRGRADDIIALGNGKNVFSRPIENLVKRSADIGECVVFGAGRPHLVAVLSLSNGVTDEAVIDTHIRWVNQQLHSHERIGAFIVASEAFSLENGLLTSQGKPRRARIHAEYGARISRAYGDE